MDTETRVAALEGSVATLRGRMDNAEMESRRIGRLAEEARAETRGWAEVALQANGKAGAAAELMKLVYGEVREIKQEVGEIKQIVTEHSVRLDAIDSRLGGMDSRLGGMDAKLSEQGDLLQRILAKVS